MKTITLVRHAKSSWDKPIEDRYRPLTNRGREDAKLMGIALKNIASKVDRIYTSPARRAQETCLLVASSFDNPTPIIVEELLYDFDGRQVVQFIKNLSDQQTHILIVGHNYAFTRLINQWSNIHLDNLPTAATATIIFGAHHWKNIERGTRIHFKTPKQLKNHRD